MSFQNQDVFSELWTKDIQEYLKADNIIIAKALIDDTYVNNYRVYLPQSGGASTVVKNRDTTPVAAETRIDTTIDYVVDNFTTTPRKIFLQTEGSFPTYDKRMSIASEDMNVLRDIVTKDVITKWITNGDDDTNVRTSGASRAAMGANQTGNRNKLTFADVLEAKRKLDGQNVPMAGRVLLLDSDLATDLISETGSQFNYSDTLANKISTEGFLGKVAGFEVYMRSDVGYTSGNTDDEFREYDEDHDAADNKVAIAYHPSMVRRALSGEKAYYVANHPLYYGDVLSFGVNAGGTLCRSDKKGFIRIIETTP